MVKWIDEKLSTNRVTGKETTEVLGRLNFAASAIDITKPFLGPLYRWATSVPEYAALKVPILLQLILRFLRKTYSDPNMFMAEAREPTIANDAAFMGVCSTE